MFEVSWNEPYRFRRSTVSAVWTAGSLLRALVIIVLVSVDFQRFLFENPRGENTSRPRLRKQASGGEGCFSTVLMCDISPASCTQLSLVQLNTDTHADMAEEAPAAAAAPAKAPAKSPKKKKAAARPKKDGLSISKLIVAAVAESKERKGMSLAALKKVLGGKGVDVTKANKRINTAVTKLVTKGSLSQTKGTGASGSFKLAKEPKAVKPDKKVVKKKAPAKAKKPAAKKTAAAKKPAAKKPAAKKSPKKAPAKKAATKKVAPKKSPKKPAAKKAKAAKKPAVKKTAAKKPAAKKAKK
ncbi:histone H1 [Oryzias latipes]|uniref:histone H1 n=1 Tax=Oryzias latipes TaxID=8090 RepID=UPI0009DA0B39|nr:histone H1 [Oryzias latipes]